MVIIVTLLLLHGTGLVGSLPNTPGVPENITVTFLNPTSVKVSWMTSVSRVDKYDVTYKPTDARVVAVVAGNSEAVTLNGLKADTQYQVTVAAVSNGKKFRSRPIVFRTLEPVRTSPQQDPEMTLLPSTAAPPPPPPAHSERQPGRSPSARGYYPPHNSFTDPEDFTNVRGVEIGIVLLVLLVWVAAIILFFNRWGKIRMLLPYQPDYKEQLKVPGTGACATTTAASTTCNGNHSTHHVCPQNLYASSKQMDAEPWTGPASGHHRPRLNSAIFISNSGPGFEPIEFLRRHGSSSRLCRKAQSEENIPHTSATGSGNQIGLPMLSISGPSNPDAQSRHSTDECT